MSAILRPIRAQCTLLRRCLSSKCYIETTITEYNKELESVFGSPLPSSFNGSQTNQESTDPLPSSSETEPHLTHVNSSGDAQMVDVSLKKETKRVATASCKVLLGQNTFNLVAANKMDKGDVLNVAKIAGITGAKQTSNLIPLCHNLNLTHVNVDITLNEKEFCLDISGEAATTGKTGVEMEALTAATVAGLTVYDMCKAASKDIQITNIRLEKKTGGKSGAWTRKV